MRYKNKIIYVLLIGALLTASYFYSLGNRKDTAASLFKNEEVGDSQAKIVVHIDGAVFNPGVYEVNSGARVSDLIELAGGALKDADLSGINLARKLYDEDKITIGKFGEQSLQSDEHIRLNTASKQELMSLPGIGESTAKKIIEYREKKRFEKIEDIMNVRGIGKKLFEDIKDKIRP